MNDYIVFDGVDSRTFGVYLFDRGNDNAPERIYSRYEIPAKNGDLLIDEKRYENVIVQYDLIAFGAGVEGRVQKFKDFMKSRIGYKRLEDSFRPEEYYMACQAAEIEVAYDRERERCRIELTFDRQPQRFLKVGETQVDVDEWGDTSSLSGTVVSFYNISQKQGFKSLVANIVPVQSGSGDPSPTNIRQISGWNGANVVLSNVNYLSPSYFMIRAKEYIPSCTVDESNQTITFVSTASTNTNKAFTNVQMFKENTQYTFILTIYKSGTNKGANMRVYYTDGTYDNIPSVSSAQTKETVVLVTDSGKTVRSLVKMNSGSSTTFYLAESAILEGVHTASDFIPFDGQTYSCIWTDTAGTVYGGNFDSISGVLTVTHGYIASYNGEVLSGEWISDRDVYSSGSSPTTGAQVVYELATPVEHVLDPDSISVLLGDNNVWADTGTVEVEYGDAPNRFENPSMFDAYPLIRVEGTGTVTIGSNTITISGNDGYTDIDCQLMEAYKGSTSRNAYVSFSGFEPPSLKEGVTTIGHSSGITSVKVIPRWWRL